MCQMLPEIKSILNELEKEQIEKTVRKTEKEHVIRTVKKTEKIKRCKR